VVQKAVEIQNKTAFIYPNYGNYCVAVAQYIVGGVMEPKISKKELDANEHTQDIIQTINNHFLEQVLKQSAWTTSEVMEMFTFVCDACIHDEEKNRLKKRKDIVKKVKKILDGGIG